MLHYDCSLEKLETRYAREKCDFRVTIVNVSRLSRSRLRHFLALFTLLNVLSTNLFSVGHVWFTSLSLEPGHLWTFIFSRI